MKIDNHNRRQISLVCGRFHSELSLEIEVVPLCMVETFNDLVFQLGTVSFMPHLITTPSLTPLEIRWEETSIACSHLQTTLWWLCDYMPLWKKFQVKSDPFADISGLCLFVLYIFLPNLFAWSWKLCRLSYVFTIMLTWTRSCFAITHNYQWFDKQSHEFSEQFF